MQSKHERYRTRLGRQLADFVGSDFQFVKELMARGDDSILNLLTVVPWWVSVVLSATAYLTLTFIVPLIQYAPIGSPMVLQAVAKSIPKET